MEIFVEFLQKRDLCRIKYDHLVALSIIFKDHYLLNILLWFATAK